MHEMMRKVLKNIAKRYSGILTKVYYLLMNNRVRGAKGNRFHHKDIYLCGLRLNFYGKGNEVILGGGKLSMLTNCHIAMHGSNCKVAIEGGVGAKDLTVYCADSGSEVTINEGTMISGKTEFAVMEGTKIMIGRGCLLSANITLRAGDSHSVIDSETGTRLNPSKDIIVGDHVWIGNTVIVTKGAIIGDNSVVATGSVVTGKTFPANSAIGGNPAKVIKEGINWKSEKV